MKSVIIPNPAIDDCEEIAALKKTRDALTEAIRQLDARMKPSAKKPSMKGPSTKGPSTRKPPTGK
jgi:hypothetical protein